MIITKLVLRDFGLYAGHHEFDLRPIENSAGTRPIILFGGKNGVGKTTILKAIRLCLYGRQALGFRVPAEEYKRYLHGHIHQSRGRSPDNALLSLEFEHVHQGQRSSFRIERSWRHTDQTIQEELILLRDGQVQFEFGPDVWQQFLKELVPSGLADLFFFDGEQIQRLADDDQGGPGLASALKELLGLNLVEQLEADLRVYVARQAKLDATQQTEVKLTELYERQQQLNDTQQARRQDKAAAVARLDRIDNKIAEKEAEIARRGGLFADRRAEVDSERAMLLDRAKQLQQALDEACGALLPFALAPTLCAALMKQFDEEELREHREATRMVLREQADILAEHLKGDSFWAQLGDQLAPELRTKISLQVQEALLAQARSATEEAHVASIHGLSSQERATMRTWVHQALGPVRIEARNAALSLAEARDQLEQAERTLNAVPPDELLAPLLAELSQLHVERGRMSAALQAATEAEGHVGNEAEAVRRDIARIEADIQQRGRKEQKGALAHAALSILPDFRHEQLRHKVRELESSFTDYFNLLARKSEFVSHVIIHELDFTMTLVSNDGRYIPKARLSSGEKQIYAIALLWALRSVSGRPLPVVIDTPLGRLDSNHRQNLVERYFPSASHQVIILSTDTEIDADYFADLEPHVSRAYHLVYDDAAGATRAEEGYFWHAPLAAQAEARHAS